MGWEVMDWDEWVYVHLDGGFTVLFSDDLGDGVYEFAKPPPGAGMKLQIYSPENTFLVARVETPEQYIYDDTQAPLDFPFYLAQFRADTGMTELDVYYGIPLTEIEVRARNGRYESVVEHGVALFDTSWNVIERSMGRMDLKWTTQPDWPPGSIAVERKGASVPGGQTVLVGVQAQDMLSGRLQSYRQNIIAERFDSTNLALSDIVLAGVIERTDEESSFTRNGLKILPMATLSFRRRDPMYVYFEIYNLIRGEEFGLTEHEVEHAVRSGRDSDEGGVLRAIGRLLGLEQRVGVARVMQGIQSDESRHFWIDTETLEAGTYTLVVTVKDVNADRVVSKERTFYVSE